MELILQDQFEEYLKESGIKYERGCKLEDSMIDFVVDFGGKIHGVEVKSSNSSIYMAVGQLIDFSRYFSHLILVATKDFLDKFNKITEETNTLKQIGLIVFESRNFIEIRKPTPTKYFFKGVNGIKEKKKSYKSEFTRFGENNEKFFRKFKGKTFMIHDIVKELKKSPGAAYHFVLMLRKLGLIEEVSAGWHPKSFRITNKLHKILDMPKQT